MAEGNLLQKVQRAKRPRVLLSPNGHHRVIIRPVLMTATGINRMEIPPVAAGAKAKRKVKVRDLPVLPVSSEAILTTHPRNGMIGSTTSMAETMAGGNSLQNGLTVLTP